MTYGEVVDTVKAYQEEKIENMRFKALLTYQSGVLTAKGVGVAFSGGKMPSIHEVFPTLFDAPKPQQNSELSKARLIEYMEYWNKKFKKKEG